MDQDYFSSPAFFSRVDILFTIAFAAAMWFQDAPAWSITLLVFASTRASRVEVIAWNKQKKASSSPQRDADALGARDGPRGERSERG